MKNYKQPGQTLEVTVPTGGWVSGNVYQVGTLVGVAAANYDAGATGILVLAGVFALPNTSSIAVAQGVEVQFDLATQTIAASGTVVGESFRASNADDPVWVLLPKGPFSFS